MSIEHACRAVGLPSLDDEDTDPTFVIPPLVKEIATERKLAVLRHVFVCGLLKDDDLEGFPLSTVSRLRELTKSLDYSHHSIDPRFHNCSLNEGIDVIQRFVVTTVCEWFIAFIGNFSVETGSAEFLSRTVSKYEESNVDIGLKNVQLISKIVDAIMRTLNDTSELDDERTVFSLYKCHIVIEFA
uniref:MOR2-PAG1_N domain-containing protein n=1 Tax=Angiostrongylus cantonensis TaxID=6313 RepID=A0A0K0CYB9_ANGCA